MQLQEDALDRQLSRNTSNAMVTSTFPSICQRIVDITMVLPLIYLYRTLNYTQIKNITMFANKRFPRIRWFSPDDSPSERRLLLKLDLLIVPYAFLAYWTKYIDQANISESTNRYLNWHNDINTNVYQRTMPTSQECKNPSTYREMTSSTCKPSTPLAPS